MAFALPLSTPISLPLPPLATFLDTLGGPLNSTGLTKLHEARSEEDLWSWFFYCIGNMARLGTGALELQFDLAWTYLSVCLRIHMKLHVSSYSLVNVMLEGSSYKSLRL